MFRRPLFFVLIAVVIIALFWYCNSKPERVREPQAKPAPLTIDENSSEFTRSFDKLLAAYYALKDALVASDTTLANTASVDLGKQAGGLQVDQIKGDTSGMIRETAKVFASNINSSAETLPKEGGLEAKRKEFEVISDALWSLARTVRYDGQKVFYQYCPMAFDNSGAYWLSDSREVRNPYFGSKMPKCGELADSLDYSKR